MPNPLKKTPGGVIIESVYANINLDNYGPNDGPSRLVEKINAAIEQARREGQRPAVSPEDADLIITID